ncbi:uncharacterized protein LOC117299076 [Asterias rubens]|nr:uncharacterized protein LOC117297851 [Asterias rubens]XP_033638383.1 uncharacterized protein LOC117299076 [Asterias rubens]
MVNDAVAPKANCKMVAVNDGKNPHLCLFAVRDIEVWEELRFDYGVPNLPWRKMGQMQEKHNDYLDKLTFCGLKKNSAADDVNKCSPKHNSQVDDSDTTRDDSDDNDYIPDSENEEIESDSSDQLCGLRGAAKQSMFQTNEVGINT